MKKLLLVLLLTGVICAVCCACGSSESSNSLLEIKGVYYGDLYSKQTSGSYEDQGLDGLSDCIVVFDYKNDDKNRELPESKLEEGYIYEDDFTCPKITLKVNDKNKYD